MAPTPFYTSSGTTPAYQLRYSWTAWPSQSVFPPSGKHKIWEFLQDAWEGDGIRILEQKWTDRRIQFIVSTKPNLTPVVLCSRLKGRLQHAFRQSGTAVNFSRKLSLRALGDPRTKQIETYICRQAPNRGYADPTFVNFLKEFTVHQPEIDLNAPTCTRSGMYWYNLHLVLVSDRRFHNSTRNHLTKIRDSSFRIAFKKGHLISTLSVMPDHLHLALRGNIAQSPEEIALGYLNNLSYLVAGEPIWRAGYYVGTFGVYDMYAVR